MAASNEVAAHIMEHLVAHDGDGGHGYSQGSNRWGNGVLETLEIDGHAYRFAGGDRDCSSGVISAYEAAGVDCGGATYTGNMRVRLCSTGNFEWKPMSYTAQRGDIYLNERSHTALCKSAVPDMLMQFSIDENGGIIGGREGDQTGSESNTRPYYDYPWDGILRFVGEGGAPAQGSQSSTIPDIRYRACSQAQGWLPEMVNHFDPSGSGDDYAGDGSPIVYLAVDMPGWYQARTRRLAGSHPYAATTPMTWSTAARETERPSPASAATMKLKTPRPPAGSPSSTPLRTSAAGSCRACATWRTRAGRPTTTRATVALSAPSGPESSECRPLWTPTISPCSWPTKTPAGL